MRFRTGHFRSFLAVALLAAVGCGPRSTPPGVSSVTGSVDGAHFVFLHAKPGLRLMILDNFTGGHSYHGSGSTSDPVYRLKGDVTSTSGHGYKFALETTDGSTARFTLADREYAISDGALFLVREESDGVVVEQLQRELSRVVPTYEGCRDFGEQDPDIKRFAESSR